LIAPLLAACGDARQDSYQGWVEGVFVFVGPDEAGRVEGLVVREGDVVAAGDALFSVDEELQQADLRVAESVLNNARNAFERAKQLLKSGSGSQKSFDDAEANLREAEARTNAARTRLTRRKLVESGRRRGAANLLPAGRDGAGRPCGDLDHSARQKNAQSSFFLSR
jgi:HlyD family secretion protein